MSVRSQREIQEPLSIPVESIGPTGHDVDCALSETWLSETLGVQSPFRPAGEGTISVHLERIDNVIHVRGRVRISLIASCSRCVEQVDLAIDTPIDVALFPEGTEPPAASDGELRADDLGVGTYSEPAIVLSAVVNDEVFI